MLSSYQKLIKKCLRGYNLDRKRTVWFVANPVNKNHVLIALPVWYFMPCEVHGRSSVGELEVCVARLVFQISKFYVGAPLTV